MMDVSDIMIFIFLLVLLLSLNVLSVNAVSELDTSTRGITMVTIPKDLYDILLNSLQKDTTGSSNSEILRRISDLETKINVYNEDRNKFFRYFEVTTEMMKRLGKMEEKIDILKQSMQEVTNTMLGITTKLQNTENELQEMKNSVMREAQEDIQQTSNSSRRHINEYDHCTVRIEELKNQMVDIKDSYKNDYNNLTDIIGNIAYELEKVMNSLFEVYTKNLSKRFDLLHQDYGSIKNSYDLSKQLLNTINKTFSENVTSLNNKATIMEQAITRVDEHSNELSNSLSKMSTRMEVISNATESLSESISGLFQKLGMVAGSGYGITGGAVEPVCLPHDPLFGSKTATPYYDVMYGSEYSNDNFFGPRSANRDVPCAVCTRKGASQVLMIPGRNKCYDGWKEEYHGYLGSNYYGHKRGSKYTCIHELPEFLEGGTGNDVGYVFYSVLTLCGSLKCPPYINRTPVTCVVCTR